MERLFSTCTRFYDILESQGRLAVAYVIRGYPMWVQELNLDASTEELLSAERAFTYADLYAIIGKRNTVTWLTPHACALRAHGNGRYSWDLVSQSPYRFTFSADGNDIRAFARSPEHLLEICDVVLRLLAASVIHSVDLKKWTSPDILIALIIAPTLTHLMEQCQSLKILAFEYLKLDEDLCHHLVPIRGPTSRSS
jgi:hypothetical protein